MKVQAVAPAIGAGNWLAGAQFADAFSITLEGATLSARDAAERMFSRSPRWVAWLLALRDAVVAPFGLTTADAARHGATDRVGMFPVISETPDRIVVGFDDKHLDFRVLVEVVTIPGAQRITATTLVMTHHAGGRAYLAVIKPFHRAVVRAMLRQVAD